MSFFSRNAGEILKAAEAALVQNNPYESTSFRHYDPVAYPRSGGVSGKSLNRLQTAVSPPAIMCPEPEISSVDIRRQVNEVIREVSELRMMLIQEREARTALLISLGQRWKEEIVVECRSADLNLRRMVAELEGAIGETAKSMSGKVQIIEQQLNEARRHSNVYSHSRLDAEDRLNDEVEELKKKFNTLSTLSSNISLECAQLIDREKSSIEQRLDRELFRYNEMRRADERETSSMKTLLKDAVMRLKDSIRSEVKDQWHETAVALEKSLWSHIEALQMELKSHRTSERELENKLNSMTFTYESDLRGLSNALKERISALESAESCTTSLVDRSQRKCDAALDLVTKMEAELQIIRDSVHTSAEIAKKATERTHQIEFMQLDRDSRISKLEAHLKAVSTAESLKGDIEACRRQVSAADGKIDALQSATERQEVMQKRNTSQIDALTAQSVRHSQDTKAFKEDMDNVMDNSATLSLRVTEMESNLEKCLELASRQGEWNQRFEQRIEVLDARQREFSENISLFRRDIQGIHSKLSERIDATNERVSRSETTSVMNKSEVERVEKRLTKLESINLSLQKEISSLRSHDEVGREELSAIKAKIIESEEHSAGREAIFEEKLESLLQVIGGRDSNYAKLESRIQNQTYSIENHIEQKIREVDDRIEDYITNMRHSFSRELNEMSRKVTQQALEDIESLESCVRKTQDAVDRIAASSAAAASAREKAMNVSQDEIQKLKDFIQERDLRFHGGIEDVKVAQHRASEMFSSLRHDFNHLQKKLLDVQGDLDHISPIVSTHENQITGLRKSIRNVDSFIRNYEKPQDNSLNLQVETLLKSIVPSAHTVRMEELSNIESKPFTTQGAHPLYSDVSSTEITSSIAVGTKPTLATAPRVAAASSRSSPVDTSTAVAGSPSVALGTALRSSLTESNPVTKVNFPPSSSSLPLESEIKDMVSSSPDVTSPLKVEWKRASPPRRSEKVELPAEEYMNYSAEALLALHSQEKSSSLLRHEGGPLVQKEDKLPGGSSDVYLTVTTREGLSPPTSNHGDFSNAIEETRNLILNEPSPEEGFETPEAVDDDENIFPDNTENPGSQSGRSTEESPPQTLQSLIKTASTSGRSKSAGSRSALEQSHTHGEPDMWDGWDSTSSESPTDDYSDNVVEDEERHRVPIPEGPLADKSSSFLSEGIPDAEEGEVQTKKSGNTASNSDVVGKFTTEKFKKEQLEFHSTIVGKESQPERNILSAESDVTQPRYDKFLRFNRTAPIDDGDEKLKYSLSENEQSRGEVQQANSSYQDSSVERGGRFIARSVKSDNTDILESYISNSPDGMLTDISAEVRTHIGAGDSSFHGEPPSFRGSVAQQWSSGHPNPEGGGETVHSAPMASTSSKNYSSFDSSSDDDGD